MTDWHHRPNGKLCCICNKELIGQQHNCCSRICANKLNSQNKKGVKFSEEHKIKISHALKKACAETNVIDIRKQTCQERYGGNAPSSSKKIQDKMKNTIRERYGVDHIMQTQAMKDHFRKTLSKKALTDDVYQKISSKEWWDSNYINSLPIVADKLGVSHSCVAVWAHRVGVEVINPFESKSEIRIQQMLDDFHIPFVKRSRQIIPPFELDIFIPSNNLAIEVNGLYWHSELNGKDNQYHLRKTLECEKQGIRLLQFWDIEVENQWDIIQSMILANLHCSPIKLGARQCKLKQNRDTNRIHCFFNDNHIQGKCSYTHALTLEYNDEIVSAITFVKSRYNKQFEWELSRFACKKGYSIPGAFSRLLKAFHQPCISYSDRRYSQGDVYKKNNFELLRINPPGYHYTQDFNSLENRMKYQKHKLSGLLESFDPALTEWENMQLNGFDRVWDCGTITWIYNILNL